MVYKEETVSSQTVFEGRIVTVKVDKVEMPGGNLAEREVVLHPGGVGVVAVTEDHKVILVKQYRKPLDKAIYEIPAGKLDKGEEPLACAKRELSEETGLEAETFTYLGFIYPSPGFTDEVTHMYLATGLSQGATHPDEDEYLDVEEVSFVQVLAMIEKNEINDAKTVCGILKGANLLKQE